VVSHISRKTSEIWGTQYLPRGQAYTQDSSRRKDYPWVRRRDKIRGGGYSALKVIDGSTWAARQAGNQHAIPETTASSAITEM
jgi:hypothetical protein